MMAAGRTEDVTPGRAAQAATCRRQKHEAFTGTSDLASARSRRSLIRPPRPPRRAGQAFVQGVQAPEVVGMLAGPAELAVEAEVRAVSASAHAERGRSDTKPR